MRFYLATQIRTPAEARFWGVVLLCAGSYTLVTFLLELNKSRFSKRIRHLITDFGPGDEFDSRFRFLGFGIFALAMGTFALYSAATGKL